MQNGVLTFLSLSTLFEVEFVNKNFRDIVNKIRLSGYYSKLLRRQIEKNYGYLNILEWLEDEKALISGSTVLSFITQEEYKRADLDIIAYRRESLGEWLRLYKNDYCVTPDMDYHHMEWSPAIFPRSKTNKYGVASNSSYKKEIDVTSPYNCTLQEHIEIHYDLDFLKNSFDGRRLIVSKNAVRTRTSDYRTPRFSTFSKENEDDNIGKYRLIIYSDSRLVGPVEIDTYLSRRHLSENDPGNILVVNYDFPENWDRKSNRMEDFHKFWELYQDDKNFISDGSYSKQSMIASIRRCIKYKSRGYNISNYWTKELAYKYSYVLPPIFLETDHSTYSTEAFTVNDMAYKYIPKVGKHIITAIVGEGCHQQNMVELKYFLGKRVLDRIERCEEAIKNGTTVDYF
jgi:hypothetical protein